MAARHLLDSDEILDRLHWAFKGHGDIISCNDVDVAMSAKLRMTDGTDMLLSVSRRAIDNLAEQIRIITAIDATGTPAAFAQIVGHIALITFEAGPKGHNLPPNDSHRVAVIEDICIDFGIACAILYAEHHNCLINFHSIPRDEICLAIVLRDQQLLGETLMRYALAGRYGLNQLVQYVQTQHDIGSADEEGELADTSQLSISPTTYCDLRAISEEQGWDADQLLMSIGEYLNPALAPSRPGRHEKVDSDRVLLAAHYWNLRSVGARNSWNSAEMVLLVEEHFFPSSLEPALVAYGNKGAGPDWERLHNWKFGSGGGVLWT
jgi:hypothetical protein